MLKDLIEWVRSLPVTPAQKLILCVLCSHADEKFKATPAVHVLVKETGLARSTVIESMNDLCKKGYIKKYLRNGQHDEFVSNCYYILPKIKTPPMSGERTPPCPVSGHGTYNINNNKNTYTTDISDIVKNGVSKKVQYFQILESRFTSMIYANTRVHLMLNRWEEALVEPKDILSTLEVLDELKRDIRSPLYLDLSVIQFAQSRQRYSNYDVAKERHKPYERPKTKAEIENAIFMEEVRKECETYRKEEEAARAKNPED